MRRLLILSAILWGAILEWSADWPAHATLYALDAQSGKELWLVANGKVYIGTHDSNLYCFGVRK